MNRSVHGDALISQRTARRAARVILQSGDCRLRLVLAVIVCAAASFAVYFCAYVISVALYEMSFGAEMALYIWFSQRLLTVVFFWLFAMPLWLGMFRMASRIADEGGAFFGDLVHYISGARLYARALGMSVRCLVCFVPAFVGYLVLSLFFARDFVGFLVVCFFVITVLLSLVFLSGRFGFWQAAMDERLSLKKAAALATTRMAGERMRTLGFLLSTLGRMLISLIPVGVPLMLHTLPSSMLSAICYAEQLAARVNDEI